MNGTTFLRPPDVSYARRRDGGYGFVARARLANHNVMLHVVGHVWFTPDDGWTAVADEAHAALGPHLRIELPRNDRTGDGVRDRAVRALLNTLAAAVYEEGPT